MYCVTESHDIIDHNTTSQKRNYICNCSNDPQHGVGVWRDLRFSHLWQCSSAVASAPNVTLPDGAVRVQEHAAGSALNDSTCFRECIFPGLQGGETHRRFPEVSE